MFARDFCFWLQGCFELMEPPSFDAHQTDCIERHLGLVFAHETNRGTRAYEFCASLRGHFEMNKNQTNLTATQSSAIKAALSKVFLYEIDPSMGGKVIQDKLNGIHKAPFKPYTSDELTLRC